MSLDAESNFVPSYSEAAEVVSSQAAQILRERRPRSESVPLAMAIGRVSAAEVIADRDQPPFNRSTRDGFACRALEINSQPVRVAGMVRAGEVWHSRLGERDAVEIMTGAPVPEGADCVVMVEHALREDASIRLASGRKLVAGDNIVPTGAEARTGTAVLTVGTRMGARHIAIAASWGRENLEVFRRPRVTVQATGDELVEVGETPLPFQIRNSNSYSLRAQVELSGAETIVMPILRDDPHATRAAIVRAATALDADLMILSGGVSMGRFDFVEDALKALGAEFFFTGAKIQPGRPVVFGRLPRDTKGWTYFFGLPGNPISTMVTFALFVHPLLNALAGEMGGAPQFALAKLAGNVRIQKGVTRFLPAVLDAQKLTPEVGLLPWKSSGDLASNARANCYLVIPEKLDDGREEMSAGEIVSVLLIG